MNIKYPNKLFTDEALENTPTRHEKFLAEWEGVNDVFDFTTFPNEGYDQIILLKNIEFASLCEHHLLPFHGSAHIGYIPIDLICGISKLARVVDKYACCPQLQERLTQQIANFLWDNLQPKGVMVTIEAAHDCMRIRGVKKQNSMMVTSALKGVFSTDEKARVEFLSLIK